MIEFIVKILHICSQLKTQSLYSRPNEDKELDGIPTKCCVSVFAHACGDSCMPLSGDYT